MKKITAFILLCVLLLTLCACTGNPTPPNEQSATKAYDAFLSGKATAADSKGKSLSVNALSTRDSKSRPQIVTFFDAQGAKEESPYLFNNAPLSKAEFDERVAPFLEEKHAELTWQTNE